MRSVPQPPPIDKALVPDLINFKRRFVVLPTPHHELVSATYVLHTWLFEAAYVTPYLYIYSREPGSGKTRYLDVLSMLVRNARRAENMTTVVMFELIERECPTLLLDEIDTVWSGSRNEPMRSILNVGYKLGGCAWRIRAREAKEFSVFSPKVLAGLNNGYMPATVRDRCIPMELVKRKPDQPIERFNEFVVEKDAQREELLDRIWQFKEKFMADVMAMAPQPIASLGDRQNEIIEPLLAVAAVLGYEAKLRKALEAVFTTGQDATLDPKKQIFERLHAAFDGRAKVFTEDLCAALGAGHNGRSLALWLEPYGIKPKDVRIGSDVKKGYTADQFMQAWSQYVDQPDAEEEEQAA